MLSSSSLLLLFQQQIPIAWFPFVIALFGHKRLSDHDHPSPQLSFSNHHGLMVVWTAGRNLPVCQGSTIRTRFGPLPMLGSLCTGSQGGLGSRCFECASMQPVHKTVFEWSRRGVHWSVVSCRCWDSMGAAPSSRLPAPRSHLPPTDALPASPPCARPALGPSFAASS